ncbi:MAG: DUF2283 domain-containing protein [Syntrophaceae bacterium]|nr:DUF2283 domain-containing protein [Syntrophaceae bacterium]
MRVKYFPDPDTALVEFTDKDGFETREISENVYADLDQDENLVNLTIEHAKTNGGLWEFSHQEILALRS